MASSPYAAAVSSSVASSTPYPVGRDRTVPLLRDPGVEPLDKAYVRVGEERPDQPGDEMRAPVREIGVDKDEKLTLGDEQRLPERFALAGMAAVLRRDVPGPVHR